MRETTIRQSDAKRTNVGASADTEDILEDAVENHFRNDPAKLAEWLTAAHIERKRSKNETTPEPVSPESAALAD